MPGVHGKQRLESRCPIANASVYEDFRALEFDSCAHGFDGCAPASDSCAQMRELWDCGFPAAAQVHSSQTQTMMCFTCRVCTVNSGWKAAVP